MLDSSFVEPDAIASSVSLGFLCSVSTLSDSFNPQLACSTKSHKLLYQDRVLLLLISPAESLRLCYTNHPVVVIGIICRLCIICIVVDRCYQVYILESVEREVVNRAHRVLSPTVNHLYKVFRERWRESFSLLRENQNSLFFSIAFFIWKPYLFLKNT